MQKEIGMISGQNNKPENVSGQYPPKSCLEFVTVFCVMAFSFFIQGSQSYSFEHLKT